MDEIRYPEIEVCLPGDKNILGLIWAMEDTLRRHHVPKNERDFFIYVASEGNSYDHAMETAQKWVTVKIVQH